ncbi:ribonuclease P protein subunit p30 [Nothobranchius furzeri]|uniref:Ribonuclease P protein subunit p30 n=1 Tax=Nothobranchius furzeri TaxID=105023 RepID=A0A1A8V4S5_NOTFU|nr:ribonuclease P protein subunit p30 [Nothobranchius furzeri]
MSVFMDLNVMYSSNIKQLQSLVETAAHLGYSTVAINYVFELVAKKKQEIPSPKPINEIFDKLPMVQGRSRPIRVLNRLTLVMSDASHYPTNSPAFRFFDLIALHSSSEKVFHAACTLYDIDIICIPVTEKLPFFFKRAPINAAIERGVAFEVSYAAAIRDSTMRRYTIANAVCLMESCKGKNVILSSAADKSWELRGPYDIANLGLLFGLSNRDAKESISSTCRSVLLRAETRSTASGIVHTWKTQQEALQDSADSEAPAAKRMKPSDS